MNSSTFDSIMKEIDGTKTFQHSTKRRIIELSLFLFFLAVGILIIIFGAVFTDQGLFFRISLIIIGSIITILYLESFLSTINNKIILSKEGLKFRSYFNWQYIEWKNLQSIEYEERQARFPKKEIQKTRIINLEFKLNENDKLTFPIHKFRVKEAEQIISELQKIYHEMHGKKHEKSTEIKNKTPITDEEIDAQIPPKVDDSEIESE